MNVGINIPALKEMAAPAAALRATRLKSHKKVMVTGHLAIRLYCSTECQARAQKSRRKNVVDVVVSPSHSADILQHSEQVGDARFTFEPGCPTQLTGISAIDSNRRCAINQHFHIGGEPAVFCRLKIAAA